jgi:hypothetical protein
VAVLTAAALVLSCTGDDGGGGAAEDEGSEARGMDEAAFFDGEQLRARQDEYLAFATAELDPTSALNVLAHAERAQREDGFDFDGADVDLTESLEKIDRMDDTSDFDMLYLLNLWYGYRDQLADSVVSAIEDRILAFKYWYTEPTPQGIVDDKWYWSENHRLIFHTIEYLAGQAFPDATFTNDGRTGAEHRDHAERLLREWIDEKVRFGFSEWHSDVYYQKDITPLLTLAEWAEDDEIARLASMMLDVVLFDVALHLQDGNMGSTHGRSYMKDKSTALDQDVFGLAKLLFDDTDEPYQSRSDAGATLFARAERYRVPEVVRRVAASDERTVDRERMGVPLDPSAPIEEHPEAPYGYDFEDPENVDFWWERGAFTTWQGIRLTFATADRYNLWETELFEPFAPMRDLVGGDPEVARPLARELAPMVALGLLSEVNTYTYRSPDVMLSSAQDYRPGNFAEQVHAWQATLDENAVVFTTHPKNEPQVGTEWPDSDGYWTGSGSLPRSAQQGTAAIHLYDPVFESPTGPPLDAFAYLDYTHAYFPQEYFDEVVTDADGHWTFGRKGDGYVALWSWRPVTWREHDPEQVFTHGMTEPFDLVAPGGAENVWIVEVGDAERWGSFGEFQQALGSAAVEVTQGTDGFDVRYASPTEGEMGFSWTGPLTVDGEAVPIADYPRYDNPWSTTPFEARQIRIAAGGQELVLDFDAASREVEPTRG